MPSSATAWPARPGIAARVFSALASGGINVVAIAQGSSERNISFAVTAEQAAEAARRVHTAFQLSKIGGGRPPAAPRTDVVFLGFGRVGRALADQIAAPTNGQPSVRVVGLLDRSGYVFEPRGFSRRRLLELTREKDAGALPVGARRQGGVCRGRADLDGRPRRVAAGPGRRDERRDRRPAARRARPWLRHRARQQEAARRVVGELRALLGSVRAGRPAACATRRPSAPGCRSSTRIHKLVETGDRVLRIEGCVSGTLMYVMSAVSSGKPFSQAVREAVELGYAEPDPRDDLTGRDAAGKR